MHSQMSEQANIICCSNGLAKQDKQAPGFEHAPTIEEAIQTAPKRYATLHRTRQIGRLPESFLERYSRVMPPTGRMK
jgi:hypothetical protein